jgi:hypothetical protein
MDHIPKKDAKIAGLIIFSPTASLGCLTKTCTSAKVPRVATPKMIGKFSKMGPGTEIVTDPKPPPNCLENHANRSRFGNPPANPKTMSNAILVVGI